MTSLPDTLDETYSRALSNIPDKHKKYAFRTFQWLIYASVPLRVDELADMLITGPHENDSVSPDERFLSPVKLIACCGTLVTTENITQNILPINLQDHCVPLKRVLRLAHFSVQEYLVSRVTQDNNQLLIDEFDAHLAIAGTSINYIMHISHDPNYSNSSYISEKYPLVSYAVKHWSFMQDARKNYQAPPRR